jgi:AraC-like DNA-binding protein
VTYSPRSVVAVRSVPEWRQWSAHLALRHWVLGYWEHIVREGTHTVRLLPDACVDITCDLSRAEEPVVYIVGPQSEPATHEVVAPARLLGARLHPLAAASLIGPRLDELTNTRERLERFVGQPAVELGRRLASLDEAAPASVFDAFFSERLIERDADPRISRSLASIFASQGQVPISKVARAAGTTERTLRRTFEKLVGLTPKRFARIVRVQGALRRVEQEQEWCRIAADLGYNDQSHLIREMKALFGDTPTGMATRRLAPK